jgi:purine-binding chemotaxis protein CheW
MPGKESMGTRQFVSFFVNDVLYGFDIRIIKEITPPVQITPVPLKPRDIHGIVNIRGQVVLVLDIAVILSGNEQPVKTDSQIVILKTVREIRAVSDFRPSFDEGVLGDKPVGFLVDTVGDILNLESSLIEEAPSHLKEQNTPYIEGVINLKSQAIILLNAGKMVSISSH